MEKDKIFFGGEGLTSTSASYLANLAKEAYQNLETALNSISFVDAEVSIIGSSDSSQIEKGVSTVSDVKDILMDIAQLKSLIAWLREAVKARERLFQEADDMSFEDFDIEVPERPQQKSVMTEADYMATLNIKQRNRYYYLDTLCAAIGSYIHPGGVFASQRIALNEAVNKPYKVSGTGKDAIIYHYKPSLKAEEVEMTYMDLQQTYRSYQAELNSMKHECETVLQKDKAQKSAEYSKELSDYKNKMEELNAQLSVLKQEKTAEIQSLKIIIPDSLKPIYDKVRMLGK